MKASPVLPLWSRVTALLMVLVVVAVLNRDQLSRFVSVGLFLRSASADRRCETAVNDRQLSEQTVKQLLAIPSQSPRSKVEALLGEPYCQLPNVTIRPELKSVRFLYRQPGDRPWLVVLYEGAEYLGSASSNRPPVLAKE